MFHEVKKKRASKASINTRSKKAGCSQQSHFSKQLKAISVDITPKDKALFLKSFNLSPATVSRYLNGQVKNNDTALKMLKFFTKCIHKRKTAV